MIESATILKQTPPIKTRFIIKEIHALADRITSYKDIITT